ncbi:Serine-threonine/tyrosine-protein kinase, catalytic domain [Sesbania bispinosa]|nr:Serine-threonine/tyrosine-protein kinase, catalytic domain [Sesbania bispinosa]
MAAEFDYEEILKATDNFHPTRLTGKGSHGLVYKALLFKDNLEVAVKKPSQSLLQDNEIRVFSSLRSDEIPHPHVLQLLGTSSYYYGHEECDSFKQKHKVIVMELMPNGSIHDWLHTATKTPLTWPKRIEIAMQIARALQFLHERKPLVIHKDIK